MKVKKTLTEILKNQTITNQFDFTGSCPDKDGVSHTYTIFKTSFFLMEVNHNYFNREVFVDKDNAFTDFCSIFSEWAYTRGPLFARIMYAYSLGYNPIENYSSIEKHTGYDRMEHGETVERSYDQDAVTTSFDNYKEKTTYNDVKDTEEFAKYGVNSSNAVNVSSDTNTKSGNQELTYSGSKTDTHSGGYSDEHSGNDTQTYNSQIAKSGNIGVLTPGEMVEKDYNAYVLHQDLQNRALKEFLDRYTFYSEGVELW